MTREEAVEILKDYKQYAEEIYHDDECYTVAFDMAIAAITSFDAIIEDIQDSHLGEWYVGRIDGKPEEVIPTETVYEIIEKHFPRGGDAE